MMARGSGLANDPDHKAVFIGIDFVTRRFDGNVDPIEGLQPGTGGDYLSVMRANLTTLKSALGCS